MAAFEAEVLDVRAGRLRYRQPVEGKEGYQGMFGRGPEPGRDEDRAGLVAVQTGRVGLVVQAGTPDVGRR